MHSKAQSRIRSEAKVQFFKFVDVKKRILDQYAQSTAPDPAAQQQQQLAMEGAQAQTGAIKAKGMRDIASAMKTFAEVSVMPHQVVGDQMKTIASLAPQPAPEPQPQLSP